MRALRDYREDNLLFYDIETAPVVRELKPNTPLFDSWAYKVNKEGILTQKGIIDSYREGAGLYPEFAKVISIVVGKIVKGKIVLVTMDDKNEVDLLNKFNRLLERNSSDTIVGFVNTGFDTPFTFKRMLINGIKSASSLDSTGLKPWEVEEVDLATIWKGTSFNRASLINISTAFGLPSPKDDIAGKDVGKVYWAEGAKGLKRISIYCGKDVVTTINVYRKMMLKEPLEVATVKVSKAEVKFADTPLIVNLFGGGKYGVKEKRELVKTFKSMTSAERGFGYVILNSITSTAKGKKTKITKAHVKELKVLVDGK